MPDLGPAVGALFDVFGPVLKVALGALLRTVAGMILFGAVVTAAVIWFSAGGSVLRGVIAAVLCGVALAVVTAILAVKNAALRGLLHGLERLGLGGRLFKLVFDQLGVVEGSEQGERAGAAGRAVERLPLAQAEARLRGAVESVLGQRAAQKGVRGWLARKLLEAGTRQVEAVTLTRFRDDQAKLGGVDLLVVRNELGAGIDALIARQVTAQLNRLNLLIAGLYVVLAALVGVAVAHIPV